jgi:hypothetical protein
MNNKLLLSLSDVRKKQYSTPYIYEVRTKNQALFYFGSKHTRDPKDPQFELLNGYLINFLNGRPKDKTILFLEGQTPRILPETLDESITKFGESGAAAFLAKQNEIPYFRPEPSLEYEVLELLKKFTKEEIFYYYIARIISQYHRLSVREDFTKYITPYIERYQKNLTWEGFDFSFDNLKNIHRSIFGKDFDLDDVNFFAIISNPTGTSTKINQVAANCTIIRNYFILGKIKEYWEKGFNIFIVYGSGHAVAQEPVIRDFTG